VLAEAMFQISRVADIQAPSALAVKYVNDEHR
jgi:hypothetical protein